jgi:hypothetical protein
VLAEKRPKDVEKMWNSIMQHMVSGHDTSDTRSAGGWNGPELETFVRYADLLGCLPEVHKEGVEATEESAEEETSGLKM